MDSAELQDAHLHGIAGHHRALALESGSAAVVLVGMVESLRYIDSAPGDLQIAFGMALFLFSIAIVLFLHHACEVLDLVCPRCQEMFHGDGVVRVASPFRRCCAHCELPASSRSGA